MLSDRQFQIPMGYPCSSAAVACPSCAETNASTFSPACCMGFAWLVGRENGKHRPELSGIKVPPLARELVANAAHSQGWTPAESNSNKGFHRNFEAGGPAGVAAWVRFLEECSHFFIQM